MKKICYWLIALTLSLMCMNGMANGITTETIDNSMDTPTSPPPIGQPAPIVKTEPAARLWNLQDADILSIINEVSLETGKNFVVDPRVTGKISLVSSKPIKPSQVYDVFLSILGLLGYSAIPSGDVVKIVPNMESGENATRVATKSFPGRGDEVVVRVIPLENVSANQVIPVIRPMLPQWSNVAAYSPGNVLILLGRASNIQRIMNVISNLDQASENHIEVVPLRQASASQMANVLNNLQSSGRASGDTPQVTIAADERSNSILLGGNKSARLRTRNLIRQLDTPTSGSQDNTEVVYLRYLQAKTLAPVLGKIAQNMMNKDGSMKSTTVDTTVITAQANVSTAAGNKNKDVTPENLTNIQAEPNTNALIITAPPGLMRAMNSIIAKLDIRPAQVLVEAVIVEINQDDLQNLGIQWGGLVNQATTSVTNAQGNGFPPFGAGVIGIIPSQQIQAVLSILQNKTGVNILSTPSIVVLDNQKASLEIGKQVPQETGTYATTGNTSTVSPFNTIQNLPVTLRLDVIPQINLGNSVRLRINLKNDSLQNPDNPGLNPITNTSKISNSVIVDSNDILVLGGLMSNHITDSVNKVPFLGDAPIIGVLFQHKTQKLEKKNLMVFLKPVILHNADDSGNITNTKYDQIRNAQINWPERLETEGEQKLQNILPPYKNRTAPLPKPFEAS
jgi:general secretion pathway protein D